MAGAHRSLADHPRRGANIGAALEDIAAYAVSPEVESAGHYDRAYSCLLDGLACGFAALEDPGCAKLLGPVVAGATMAHGARVPGTSYELDPVTAAFNIGVMVLWLDRNAAGLAADWGHPADNLGAILAVGDYMARTAHNAGQPPLVVADLLRSLAKAHEMQRRLASATGFDRSNGWTVLVRIASAAAAADLLGGGGAEIAEAVTHAWLDGGAFGIGQPTDLRDFRGSWAAGDANSRGVRLALIALAGGRRAPPRARIGAAIASHGPPAGPVPRLPEKFAACVAARFSTRQAAQIRERCADFAAMSASPVQEFIAMLIKNG